MPELFFGPDSNVRAVMDAHSETVAVFLRRRMHFPGCVMSPFVTWSEAAANYEADPAELVAELRTATSPVQRGEKR